MSRTRQTTPHVRALAERAFRTPFHSLLARMGLRSPNGPNRAPKAVFHALGLSAVFLLAAGSATALAGKPDPCSKNPKHPKCAPGTTDETTSTTTGTTEPGFELYYSATSDRANPQPLKGTSLSGGAYVFTMHDSATASPVRFHLDEEPDSTPLHTESNAPYDMAGGTAETANPWDTARVANGTHTVVAVDEAGRRAEATVSIDNAGSPSATEPGDGTVLYRLDWEADGKKPADWGYQCDNIDDWYATRGTYTVVTSPIDKGTYAARNDLPADTSKPTACEALHGRRLDHGAHDYFSLAVRFPGGWQEPSKAHWGMAIFQPNYQGIKGPAVGLFAHIDYVNLVLESGYCANDSQGVFRCEYNSGNGSATGNVGTHYAIPTSRFAKNVWHELVVHVHWRADSTGIVEVFHRRKGESTWVKTAVISGYPTLQWKDNYDPTSDKSTTDKVGAYRGQASHTIAVHHDSWCRATTFASAAGCF